MSALKTRDFTIKSSLCPSHWRLNLPMIKLNENENVFMRMCVAFSFVLWSFGFYFFFGCGTVTTEQWGREKNEKYTWFIWQHNCPLKKNGCSSTHTTHWHSIRLQIANDKCLVPSCRPCLVCERVYDSATVNKRNWKKYIFCLSKLFHFFQFGSNRGELTWNEYSEFQYFFSTRSGLKTLHSKAVLKAVYFWWWFLTTQSTTTDKIPHSDRIAIDEKKRLWS